MDKKIELFIKARDHIHNTISQKIETYLIGDWNPIIKYQLIKHTTDIIHNEVLKLFPDLDEKDVPKCRIKLFEDTHEVEAGIQNYYNHENGLTFLGTISLGDEIFDCYYRYSYDPRFKYMFIARFGHEPDDYVYGSKTAAAEYYLGQYTPLSMAYGLAVEDGFIG